MRDSAEALNTRATGQEMERNERDIAQNHNPHDVLFVARAGHLVLQGLAVVAPPGKPLNRLIEPDPADNNRHWMSYPQSSDRDITVAMAGHNGLTMMSNGRRATSRQSPRNPLFNFEPVYPGPPPAAKEPQVTPPALYSLVEVNRPQAAHVSLSRVKAAGGARFTAEFEKMTDGVGYFLPAYGMSGKPYIHQPKAIRLGVDHTEAKLRAAKLLGKRAQLLIYSVSTDPDLAQPGPWLNDPVWGRAIKQPQHSSKHY